MATTDDKQDHKRHREQLLQADTLVVASKRQKREWDSITDISGGRDGGYGLGSNGYNDTFLALDKPTRERILATFAPKTGERPKVQPNVPYPCPANNPFKEYMVLIDGDDHASIRHKKHTDKPLNPSRKGQVDLCFTNASDGSRQNRKASYRKVVVSFVYPEWCMQQFNVDMFNSHGQSSGMIHVDHIEEVAMGGTDLDRVSNWQLLIARDTTCQEGSDEVTCLSSLSRRRRETRRKRQRERRSERVVVSVIQQYSGPGHQGLCEG
jgi:hypothetical protein